MDDKELAEIEELYRDAAEENTPDLWARIEKKIVEEESRAAEEEFLRERSDSDDTVGMTGTLKSNIDVQAVQEEAVSTETEETVKLDDSIENPGMKSDAGFTELVEEAKQQGEKAEEKQAVKGSARSDKVVDINKAGKGKPGKERRYMWKVVGLAAAAAVILLLGLPPMLRLSNRTLNGSSKSDQTMNVAASDSVKNESPTAEATYAADEAPAAESAAAEAVEEEETFNYRGNEYKESIAADAEEDTPGELSGYAAMEDSAIFRVAGAISEQGGSYYISIDEMLDDSGIPAEVKNFYSVKNLQLLIVRYEGFDMEAYVGKTVVADLSLIGSNNSEFGNEMYSVELHKMIEK